MTGDEPRFMEHWLNNVETFFCLSLNKNSFKYLFDLKSKEIKNKIFYLNQITASLYE